MGAWLMTLITICIESFFVCRPAAGEIVEKIAQRVKECSGWYSCC